MPWGVIAATFFEVVVIFVLAEALPKNWAVQNPERSALFAAPVRVGPGGVPAGADGVQRAHRPWPTCSCARRHRESKVSESELLAMADVAMEEDVIEHQERELIHSIIEFGDTVVREVMVPRPDMRAVEADVSVSEALGVAMEAGFSRLPVHEGNLDDVVGHRLRQGPHPGRARGQGERPVSDFVRPAHFVPETKRVSALMREMQERKFHLAIVVDEYGGTAGLVTLEDLIEELVGEIVDEFDVEEPPVQPLGGRRDVGDGPPAGRRAQRPARRRAARRRLGHRRRAVFNLLGPVPVEGESVDVDGVRLVAERVQGHRIGRIRILPLTAPEPRPRRR